MGPRGERAFGPGDFLIEELARALHGGTLWGGMKRSAELASAAGGGADYVAGRAGVTSLGQLAADPRKFVASECSCL